MGSADVARRRLTSFGSCDRGSCKSSVRSAGSCGGGGGAGFAELSAAASQFLATIHDRREEEEEELHLEEVVGRREGVGLCALLSRHLHVSEATDVQVHDARAELLALGADLRDPSRPSSPDARGDAPPTSAPSTPSATPRPGAAGAAAGAAAAAAAAAVRSGVGLSRTMLPMTPRAGKLRHCPTRCEQRLFTPSAVNRREAVLAPRWGVNSASSHPLL